MRALTKMFALALSCLAVAPALQAQQTISVLTCTGSGPTLTLPVYSVDFDTNSNYTFFFSTTTNLSEYNLLLSSEFFGGTYDTCKFSNGMGNAADNVKIEDVALVASQAAAYSQVTFSFTLLELGPSSLVRAKGPATTEEKAKALAAFQARVPALLK